MKVLQLVAFGLIGWYLLIPPPREVAGNFETNFSAPLTKWAELRRFDSASACEAARGTYAANPPGGVADMLAGKRQERATMDVARCVSSKDPRLKRR